MKRGWCPSLHEPMRTGDGLLSRVKPPGGRLTCAAARGVAQAAMLHGNGVIELTSRGNLQVRGLTDATAPRFAAAVVAAGLACADAGAERRRNVMLSPLAGDDPAAAPDAVSLAAAVEAMLAAEPALAALPGKFGFAVNGGGVLDLSEPADITVRTDGARHWIVLEAAQAPCAPSRTVSLVRDLARAAGSRRVRDVGAAALFASVGLAPTPFARHPAPAAPAGFIAYPGTGRGAFALSLPFGQTDAATLETVAELAERRGDGLLRVSSWRALLLGGVQARHASALRAAAAAAGLVADADDPRLRVAACIGSAGCASGTVRAREDAAALAAAANWAGVLHVSGCAKGCAHPDPASRTLVGAGGAYNLVRNGRADGPPQLLGLSPRQAATRLGDGP